MLPRGSVVERPQQVAFIRRFGVFADRSPSAPACPIRLSGTTDEGALTVYAVTPEVANLRRVCGARLR